MKKPVLGSKSSLLWSHLGNFFFLNIIAVCDMLYKNKQKNLCIPNVLSYCPLYFLAAYYTDYCFSLHSIDSLKVHENMAGSVK